MPWKNPPRTYRIFCSMNSRCNNPKFPRYPDYGGRGISICSEWKHFRDFNRWALNNGYKSDLCIDRIDNDGNYSPDNCRWVTPSQQNRNKRSNRLVTIFGETKTLVEWSEDSRCRISYPLLRNRLSKKWSPEEALTKPREEIAKPNPRLITYQGTTRTLFNWCKILGLKPAAIYARHKRGLSPAEILAPIRQVAPYGSKKNRRKVT